MLSLRITAEGYNELVADIQLARGQSLDLGDLGLLNVSASGSLLRGTVTDAATGTAVAGARVVLDTGAESITESQGHFTFSGLESGTIAMTISASGFETVRKSIVVEAGSVHLVLVSLNATGSGSFGIGGTVTDAQSGAPLADVTIIVGGDASATATTDADGQYSLTGLPTGYVTLEASKANYCPATASAQPSDGQHLTFSPALESEVSCDGSGAQSGMIAVIEDLSTGESVAGATVTLKSIADSFTATSDANGRVALSADAGEYELTVAAEGYRSFTQHAVINESLVIDYGAISLSPEGYYPSITLSGTVLDSATGLALPAATVSVVYSDDQTTVSPTADGTFAMMVDGEREVDIRVEANGYQVMNWSLKLPAEDLNIGQLRLRPEGLDALRPDVTLALSDLSNRVTDPASLEVSGFVKLDVFNIGKQSVEKPFEIVAFLDGDGDGRYSDNDINIGKSTFNDVINANGVGSATLELAGTLPFRDAPVHFVADPGNHLIELRDDNNLVGTVDACRVRPERGQFDPVEKWRWAGGRVTMTPLAAPLIDTNQDGVVDVSDDIHIVFIASSGFPDNAAGVLVAVNGRTGEEAWRFTDVRFNAPSQIAIGDVDGDGKPEIIGSRYWSGMAAVNGDGTLKWQSPNPSYRVGLNYGGPILADLDADGYSEIIFDKAVMNHDGTLRWIGSEPIYGGQHSMVADIDLDGRPDIIVGPAVYDIEGNLIWRASIPDGRAAIARLSDDPHPHIVVAGARGVRVLDHQGNLVWGPVIVARRGGGAPTIGDVNGDGLPEIGVAGDYYYYVINADGSVRWRQPIYDPSEQTGSTFFDFDGDNRVEVVYFDQNYLRVFDGDTGEVVFQIRNRSVTAREYAIVVDIDGDNHAELVVPSYDNTMGIRAFEDHNDSWVNVRRVWNQYSYHITNINDDMNIPRVAENNWDSYNNYRVNSVPDPTRVADLTASLFQLRDNGPGNALTATIRVGNGGGRDAHDVKVSIRTADPADGGSLWAEAVVPKIGAGGFVDITIEGESLPADPLAMHAEVNSDGAAPECFAHNNSMLLTEIPIVGNISVTTDAAEYAPEQPVALTGLVENTGSFTRVFEAQLRIEDSAGNIVAELQRQALGELASGEQRVLQESWNTARYLAGDYRVRALLYAADGELLASDTTSFAIAHDATGAPLAALRLATDRALYHTTDQVRIELLAQNQSVSTLLNASSVRVTVTDPVSELVFQQDLNVRELGAGNTSALFTVQALTAAAIGNYTVTASWRDAEGDLLAAAERNYAVYEDLAKSLQGSVTVSAPELYVGDSQACTERVRNTGTQTASVNLRRTLARLDVPGAKSSQPIAASIDPGQEQTWLRGVSTAGMAEGDYACVLEAEIEGAWQPLANAFFRLLPPPIRINAMLEAGTRGRVLVLLDPACAELGEEGVCDAEPYGPDFAPPLPIQREHVEAVLTEAGWTYTIVTSAAEFETEFRSNGYELYALFNEVVKLPEALQRDVVADIESGRGLLVAGNHDRRNGRLEEALGTKSLGKNLEIEKLVVQPFGEHEGGEILFNVAHWPNALRLESAEVLGEFQLVQKGGKPAAPEPALTRNAHGNGTGTYAAFDWPAQSAAQGDDGELAGLLTATLDVTHPEPYASIAGRVISLQLALQNEGMATPGEVHFALPAGTTLVSGPEGATVADGIVRWPFTLAEAEQEAATLWLQLPATSGPLTFEAVIYAGEGDSLTEHVRTQIVLNVLPQE